MAVSAKPKLHYFVINQLGQSCDRRGPFVSEDAAEKWAEKHFPAAAWIVPARPVGRAKTHKPLDENGSPVQTEE
jgi:hypothetical protein